ncbi:LysM peptidoglycan-binding domain-containing protein [Ilumatobacter nonamiensis]|uniref:LysM peptidoglycan-binding domain-containing protein n=1 Tax=Ilumatobacter nonamiensis TaxID=467093 RepID=UPI000349B59B|nr:LysM peptidoglycan-binding domain-containing protein [Ilumatobacter nonamiensis]
MTTPSPPPSQPFGRAALSIGALLLLFVAVPVGLVGAARSRLGEANPFSRLQPPWRWQLDEVRDALTQPLRDDAIVNVLIRASLVVIWIALIVIAITIVAETVHMVRHRGLPAPHVRGLGWAQGIGRWVAIGLVAVLPLQSFGSTAAAHAEDLGPAATAQRLGVDRGSSVAPSDAHAGDPAELARPDLPDWNHTGAEARDAPAGTHVVGRGESIYAIAAEYAAGDDASTIALANEILDRNLDNEMNDGQRFTNPALIQPGWVLELPPGVGVPATSLADVTDAPDMNIDDDPTPVRGIPRLDVDPSADGDDEDASEANGHVAYMVVEGDTLSGIAGDHRGGADEWPAIWEENRGTDMGDGRTFDDPNLIVPGWELDIPQPATAPETEPEPAGDEAAPSEPTPVDRDDPVDPGSHQAPPPRTEHADRSRADATPSADEASPPTTTSDSEWAPASTTQTTNSPTTPESTASTSSVPVSGGNGEAGGRATPEADAPRAPSPIRIEHAALLAAGILTLVGVRRRRALRSALPHSRIPPPPPDVAATARRLRTIEPGERAARIDVGIRAAAHRLAETGTQIGSVRVAKDGELTLRLTGDGSLDAPWTGSGRTWTLPAAVPIEMVSEDARQVGQPCLALVTVGVDTDGRDVLVDLEAAGLTTVEAGADQADEVVRAIGSGLATSLDSEVVHLVVASLGAQCLFDHPNARHVDSVDGAIATAASLVGTTLGHERSSFDLRTHRTGGEMWEPAVALFAASDHALDHDIDPRPGRGLAHVAACAPLGDAAHHAAGARIVGHADRWVLDAFGEEIDFAPIGITAAEVTDVAEMLDDATRPIGTQPSLPLDIGGAVAEPLRPLHHDIVVGLMGPVTVTTADGEPGVFERSKTVELIAWLATHRERATRSAARTALWELDVRDATFANVVSEARRALGRLVAPPGGEEWLARTLNESLPLHDRVVTDTDLIAQRVEHARLAPPAHAIDVLRPAVEMIRGLPFSGTSYLWPDADGLTSSYVLLATTASAELAGHALSIGDTDLVFWATGQGLKVLPGHEELVGLRMRAHARAGDLAGVRQEWESYERVITADAWSDGDPAPKLLDLRRELLTAT